MAVSGDAEPSPSWGALRGRPGVRVLDVARRGPGGGR